MKKMKRILALHSATDFSIHDETGAVVSLDEAQRRWACGLVDDWNGAFDRLANGYKFDLEAVKDYYASRPTRAAGGL